MWNDLTMRERADLIRQGVALGYKDIDSIRNNYHIFGKGSTLNSSYQDPNPYYNRLSDNDKKIWRNLAAQRQKFDQMMQQYSPQIYNDPQLRNTMEYIAFHENKWNNVGVSSQGARGHFQLMPDTIATARAQAGRNFDVKNPSDDFAMMQITALNSMKNIDRLLKDPEFRRKAQERNYDKYDLLMSSWLSGPGGMEKNIRNSKYNPKDAYGTSIGKYVGDTGGYTRFGNPMVVSTGPEGKVVTINTPEDVARQLAEEEQAQSQTYSQGAYQEEQPQEQIDTPVSDTFLKDQYERLVEQNAELSQADQEMKEKWNQMMENVQAEQERQNIVSMINTLGWQKAQPITPVQGQITNDERVYNNPVLAAQMYNRRNNRISNGSFGKYFFNGQEDNTPMILGYNPYSPVMAFGGLVHRYDYAGTVNTPYSNNNNQGQQVVQNQFAVPQYYPSNEWDPEEFYPTTRLGPTDAIYDNIDMTKPYEPIQSYPRVGEVNPIYENPTVKGEPVKILHRVDDNDNQAVARYQDGELGIVNLPDNYWQRYLPEVVVPGRMQQLQGVIDKAQEGKGVYDIQQDLDDHLRYMDEKDRAQQDAFYNPRAVLNNASKIPLVGILPTVSEYAYGVLKGGPEGQYWKDRAGGAANEQMLPVGLVAANTNPVTAAMADSALLGSSLYDIDRNGLNAENGIGLALGMMGPSVRGTQLIKNNTLPYNLGNIDVTGGAYFEPTVQEVAESSPYKYKDPDVSMASIYKDYMKQQQLNEVRQYMQKGTVPDKYVLERGSKKFVEGEDGIWEETDFRELPKGWDRTVYEHLPEEVIEELENSTKPRMMAMRTDDPENVPYTDYKTWLFNQAWNKAVTNRKWVGVSDKVWQDYNRTGDNRTLAYITNDGKTIVANKDRHPILLNDDLGHEAEHGIDFEHSYLDILQRTKEEDALLHTAYNEEFDAVPTVEWTKLDKDYDMNPERKTLNRDARRKLLGSSGVRRLPWKRQNDYIRKATKEEVIDAVRKADGYGQAYIELLEKKYGEIPDDIVNAMRKAMMYVGVGTGIAVTVNKEQK